MHKLLRHDKTPSIRVPHRRIIFTAVYMYKIRTQGPPPSPFLHTRYEFYSREYGTDRVVRAGCVSVSLSLLPYRIVIPMIPFRLLLSPPLWCCMIHKIIRKNNGENTAAVPVELNGVASPRNGHHAASPAASASAVDSAAAAVDPPGAPPPPSPQRFVDDVATMKALGKQGRWREVLCVLDRLKEEAAEAAEANEDAGWGGSIVPPLPPPDLMVYNAAIGALSKSGKWDEVSVYIYCMHEVYCRFCLFVFARVTLADT